MTIKWSVKMKNKEKNWNLKQRKREWKKYKILLLKKYRKIQAILCLCKMKPQWEEIFAK